MVQVITADVFLAQNQLVALHAQHCRLFRFATAHIIAQ
jgi:hypothetical protein